MIGPVVTVIDIATIDTATATRGGGTGGGIVMVDAVDVTATAAENGGVELPKVVVVVIAVGQSVVLGRGWWGVEVGAGRGLNVITKWGSNGVINIA